MEIKIRVLSDEDQEPLQSIYEWLKDDTDVRISADIRMIESRPQPGSQSGEIELITLIVSSGFNMAQLGIAIATWRSSLKKQPAIRVEVEGTHSTVTKTDTEPMAIEK